MKARYQQVLDKSKAALLSAIELYNKPQYLYREESFAILCINAYELLFKAKWLHLHNNKLNSLYTYEYRITKSGKKSKKKTIKTTRSNNPLTREISYLANKLIEQKLLNGILWANVQLLLEIRDCSIHYYNKNNALLLKLHQVALASVKNFGILLRNWFPDELSDFSTSILPIAIMDNVQESDIISLEKDEVQIIQFIQAYEETFNDDESEFSISLSLSLNLKKAKPGEAVTVRIGNTSDIKLPTVRLSDEQIRERYPITYNELSRELRLRYSDFKMDSKYHELRKAICNNKKYCYIRELDPGNEKTQKKQFYSNAIIEYFDQNYEKKGI